MSTTERENPYYLDSSVLVALIAPGDRQHDLAVRLVRGSRGPIVTSAITEVEIGRALARRSAPSSVQRAARELLDRCEVVEVTMEVRQQAVEVRPASTRSLDAVHVATALVAGVGGFATFDARQGVAAEEMGLKALVS